MNNNLKTTTWLDRVQTTSKLANLEALETQDLCLFLEGQVFMPQTPQQIQAVFAGQLLEDAVWDTKHHGVKTAINKLQFILGLMLVTAGGSFLERDGLIGPTACAALEFTLANMIPEVHPARLTTHRIRLRRALEGRADVSVLRA
jgi:hypothetical protein